MYGHGSSTVHVPHLRPKLRYPAQTLLSICEKVENSPVLSTEERQQIQTLMGAIAQNRLFDPDVMSLVGIHEELGADSARDDSLVGSRQAVDFMKQNAVKVRLLFCISLLFAHMVCVCIGWSRRSETIS